MENILEHLEELKSHLDFLRMAIKEKDFDKARVFAEAIEDEADLLMRDIDIEQLKSEKNQAR